MKSENIIQQKSFAFAIRIVKTHKFLIEEKREFILSKQMMRSGTSVGANVEESIGAHSKADFLWKLSIAYREARETLYWLKLLKATNYLGEETADSMLYEAEEICRIIGKIQITVKKGIARGKITNGGITNYE